MTYSPNNAHPRLTEGGDLGDLTKTLASQNPAELTHGELQKTRVLLNTYGSGCILGVLHSDTGLTDAAWSQLVQVAEALWSALGLADLADQEDAIRADRDTFFAQTTYPADVRAKIEEAWDDEDRLAIIEILAAHDNLDVSVAGWSSWGVSTVYF